MGCLCLNVGLAHKSSPRNLTDMTGKPKVKLENKK